MRKRYVAVVAVIAALLMMTAEFKAGTNVDYTSKDYTSPVKAFENAKSISLGGSHNGAVTEDGTLYVWGSNSDGQLGDGMWRDRGKPVKVLENIQTFSMADGYSGAVTKDGILYMWGRNMEGQLGDGTHENRRSPVKVLENVQSIRLLEDYSGAVTKDGTLYMWGKNSKGQLGDGTCEDHNSPVKVLENVRSIRLRGDRSGAVTEDGTLYMWGHNFAGALGDGTQEDRNSPVKVLENVQSFSLGLYHSAAVTKDGILYMWGNITSPGKIIMDGVTKYVFASYPNPVKVLENVQSVNLGEGHSAAVTKDGVLYVWGDNKYGQVGNGANEECLNVEGRPVKVLENVQSVSLGWYHSAAVTKDGALYMWGRNDRGQLGDGTRQARNIPLKVLEHVQEVRLDYNRSEAMTEDGSVYMWGANLCDTDDNDIVIEPSDLSPPKLSQKITFHTSAIKKGKVIYGASFSLNAKTTGRGKLVYKSSNAKVLSINAKGKVTVKGYGPAYIQIKAMGGDGYKAAVRKIKLTAIPKQGKVTKAKLENGAIRFQWKAEKSADGYEYAAAYNPKFSGQSRKKTKKTGIVLTKYKTGTKKMFLKVRVYKKIGKKAYYGSWSKPRWVKLKKGRKAGQTSYSVVG